MMLIGLTWRITEPTQETIIPSDNITEDYFLQNKKRWMNSSEKCRRMTPLNRQLDLEPTYCIGSTETLRDK